MNRLLFFILFFSTLSVTSQAQTLKEWLRQKKTQRKYLLQQIVALQVYIEQLQKGYEIARKGLTTIGNIKDGEFKLHQDYFNSLKTVNPVIKKYSRVADIHRIHRKIIDIHKNGFKLALQSDAFNPAEIDYINRVYQKLVDDCNITLDQLDAVLKDQKLEMTDDKRMKSIDDLYLEIQNKYSFIKGFNSEVLLLSAQRMQEESEIEESIILNGINDH